MVEMFKQYDETTDELVYGNEKGEELRVRRNLKVISGQCPICEKRAKLMAKLDKESKGGFEERERMIDDYWEQLNEAKYTPGEETGDAWKDRNVLNDEWHNYDFDLKMWKGHSHYSTYKKRPERYPADPNECYAGEPVPSDLRHPIPYLNQVKIDGEMVLEKSLYAQTRLAGKKEEDTEEVRVDVDVVKVKSE